MKEQLIEFSTAKLAKEKGFDWGCTYFYAPHKKPHEEREPYEERGLEYGSDAYVEEQNWNDGYGSYPTKASDVLCSAPTQSLLQRWLRDAHNIHLESSLTMGLKHSFTCYQGLGYEGDTDDASYEEALEEGLLMGLNLIK